MGWGVAIEEKISSIAIGTGAAILRRRRGRRVPPARLVILAAAAAVAAAEMTSDGPELSRCSESDVATSMAIALSWSYETTVRCRTWLARRSTSELSAGSSGVTSLTGDGTAIGSGHLASMYNLSGLTQVAVQPRENNDSKALRSRPNDVSEVVSF